LENTCRVQKEMDRKDFEKTYGLGIWINFDLYGFNQMLIAHPT
jgi:hypothetical protein